MCSVLILTRKSNQVIVLGNKDNEVRLGIVAASDVVVDREEVAERKRQRDKLTR